MTKKKIFLSGLVAVGVAIQFIRPEKNDSPDGPDALAKKYPPPPEVQRLLETACYDCHSNRTRYPWYAQVQPVGWWLASHINEGKDKLNFSEFAAYSAHDCAESLKSLTDEVQQRSMPLKSYTWIHRDAILTDAQIKTLADWADALANQIEPDK